MADIRNQASSSPSQAQVPAEFQPKEAKSEQVSPRPAAYTAGYEHITTFHPIYLYQHNIASAVLAARNQPVPSPTILPTAPAQLSSLIFPVTAKTNGTWYSQGYLDALHKIQDDDGENFDVVGVKHECGLLFGYCQAAKNKEGRNEVHAIWKRMCEIRALRAGLRHEDTTLWWELFRMQREN